MDLRSGAARSGLWVLAASAAMDCLCFRSSGARLLQGFTRAA